MGSIVKTFYILTFLTSQQQGAIIFFIIETKWKPREVRYMTKVTQLVGTGTELWSQSSSFSSRLQAFNHYVALPSPQAGTWLVPFLSRVRIQERRNWQRVSVEPVTSHHGASHLVYKCRLLEGDEPWLHVLLSLLEIFQNNNNSLSSLMDNKNAGPFLKKWL